VSKESVPVTAKSIRMLAELVTYDGGYYKGKLYSQFLDEPFEFFTLIKMLEKMEAVFDEKKFPQAFLSLRTFGENKKKTSKPVSKVVETVSDDIDMTHYEGKCTGKCTFEILVSYRQNASWQGQILWVEKKQKQDFQSELEMLKLMDEALIKTGTNSEQVAWNA